MPLKISNSSPMLLGMKEVETTIYAWSELASSKPVKYLCRRIRNEWLESECFQVPANFWFQSDDLLRLRRKGQNTDKN